MTRWTIVVVMLCLVIAACGEGERPAVSPIDTVPAASGDKAQPVSARDLVGRLEAILTLYDFRNRAVLSGDVPASEQWVSMMDLAARTAKLRDEAEAEAERTRSLRLQKLAEAAGHAYTAIADTALLMHDYPDGGTTTKVEPIAARIRDSLNRTTECLDAARLAGDPEVDAGEAQPALP